MKTRRGRLIVLKSTAALLVSAALLAGAPAADAECGQFPATGQTTCWDSSGNVISCQGTGQDGDIRAGIALHYQDNGDGTITDLSTSLMWEKLSIDGSIHDVGNTYTWATAFAHVDGLNVAHFAKHHDWRLPNVKELQSLVDYEKSSPAIAAAFNRDCRSSCTVLTCSCTQANRYWSSSTVAIGPTLAWRVDFNDGTVVNDDKSSKSFVRGVRGGCRK